LAELSLEEFRQFSPLFEADILQAIKIETCVQNRNSHGGTSPVQVARQVANAKALLTKQQGVLDTYRKVGL